jgi:hypothetical protein
MEHPSTGHKPPVWFWAISGVAFLWNLMGVGAYIMQITMSDETLAALPAADQAVYAAQPAWYMGAFAIAVFAAVCGCVGLMLRKKWAVPLFVTSLIAVILQQMYIFITSDIGKSLSGFNFWMTISIPIIALFLVWFARMSAAKGWLK